MKQHKMTNTKEFNIWSSMRERVNCKPGDKHHAVYKRRGIGICSPWQSDFMAFRAYLEETIGLWPGLGYTLDRIDNDKGYEPGNLRWATAKEQANNRSNSRWITYQGKTMTASQWADALGITKNSLYLRLRNGWSLERALQPINFAGTGGFAGNPERAKVVCMMRRDRLGKL